MFSEPEFTSNNSRLAKIWGSGTLFKSNTYIHYDCELRGHKRTIQRKSSKGLWMKVLESSLIQDFSKIFAGNFCYPLLSYQKIVQVSYHGYLLKKKPYQAICELASPPCQNESLCQTNSYVHFQVNQNHFQMKGFARGLV